MRRPRLVIRHPAWPLAAAAGTVAGGGAGFSAAEHVAFPSGAFWALLTASTVGDGVPRDHAGRVIIVAVILTAVPCLGLAWNWALGRHVAGRLRPHHEAAARDAAAARRIMADLYRHVTDRSHPDEPPRRFQPPGGQ